ncbi:O-antigen ligase family protein [Planctomycetota bacterium]
MNKGEINSDSSKSRGQVILEYVLLGICLCILTLRTTLTEGLHIQAGNQPIYIGAAVFSLLVSSVLILAFVVWFVWSFCISRFFYRFSGIEIGLCLFLLASVIAGFAAPNKRAAITETALMIAPLLCAVLLVQLLDSQSKIKFVLIVIAALGIVSAYQCEEQMFHWNEQQIQFYEHNPQMVLGLQNITPNSLAHWQFEHRLYSRGVHGFFTTSNSAGSFAMLASFAAVALFLERFKNRRFYAAGASSLIALAVATAVIILGFAITRSKGATIASVIAVVMLILLVCFGKWVKVHKKAILIFCLLVGLAGGCIVVWYGLTYDGLPGGNSMLVRWQYWTSTVKMYGDHFLTGVGPGNFSHFYPRYKLPQALESVSDPHNFLLSLLSQYGPLGLIGFLAAFAVPLRIVGFWDVDNPELASRAEQSAPRCKTLVIGWLIVASAVMLLVRPLVLAMDASASYEEKKAAVVLMYIMPVVVFVVGFLLLAAPFAKLKPKNKIPCTQIMPAALFCACLGCLLHNLIDFAIFEPGVSITFWMVLACLIAMNFNRRKLRQFAFRPGFVLKVFTAAGGLVLILLYFHFVVIPVTDTAEKIRRAMSEPESAHKLLDQASQSDRLDASVLSLNGNLYLQQYRESTDNQPQLLKKAVQCFLAAIECNSADYKNFESQTECCNLLAETSTQRRDDWLQRAFDSAQHAVELYPGCARLRVTLAESAEKISKTDFALMNYKKAIEIEDSFRRQFHKMYPDEPIFSRLDRGKYDLAKQKIVELNK